MSRLLFFAAVAAVVYWLLKSYRARLPKEEGGERAEDMVRCAYCGVHLPESESTMSDGKHYCSEAHRQAADVLPR